MSQRRRVNFISIPRIKHIYAPAKQALTEAGHEVGDYPSLEALVADKPAMAAMDVVVALHDVVIDRPFLMAAPKLRAVATPFIGIEGFDRQALTDLGVVIANGQTVENYSSMAEATILMVLASLYDLDGAQRLMRENLPRPAQRGVTMLMRKSVGIIGFGKIGQSVAERLSTWNVKLTTYVRTPRALPAYVGALPLEQLLAESDVVLVLAELNAESHHLLDAARLALMKPKVLFVNMSRGGLVDEKALVELARQRPEMRLALDVFEVEPPTLDNPLRQIPKAVLTPHILGHTVDSAVATPILLTENIMAALEGRAPPCLRNPEALTDPKGRWAKALA